MKGDGENLKGREGGMIQYLVIKATATIEVLEERGVGLVPKKVHIGDLKVAPNCFNL